jgi:excisionase family DNA binding protein
MVQFRYNAQARAGLRTDPEDRTAAVGDLVGNVGGRLLGLYWAFGDYDGVAIIEAPDNVAIGGAIVAVVGSGAFDAVHTTPLFTSTEGRRLLELAGRANYRPPTLQPTFLDQTLRMRQARMMTSGELIAKQDFRVEEVAQLYGLSVSLIRSAVHRRELPATVAGHTIVSIKRRDLLRWLEERSRVS